MGMSRRDLSNKGKITEEDRENDKAFRVAGGEGSMNVSEGVTSKGPMPADKNMSSAAWDTLSKETKRHTQGETGLGDGEVSGKEGPGDLVNIYKKNTRISGKTGGLSNS